MKRRFFALLGASALIVTGFAGATTVLDAQPAQAATCTYSNLTSTSVKNVNCKQGAYGHKSSKNASTGTRVGQWVSAGKFSYNPNNVCYTYPTMVRG